MLKSKKRIEIDSQLATVPKKQQRLNSKGESRDNSARFRLLGGPYHDKKILMFAPFDKVVLMDESVYELHGPLTGDEYVYTFNPDLTSKNIVEGD